jgi:hypothetical protein
VGEDVIRVSTGEVVSGSPGGDNKEYLVVGVSGYGQGVLVLYHRLKFFLANGWMPAIVDHWDRNTANNTLANLRPATKAQNAYNSGKTWGQYPRGVHRCRDKFQARAMIAGVVHHLGTFDTPEEAGRVAAAFRKKHHGAFYAPT